MADHPGRTLREALGLSQRAFGIAIQRSSNFINQVEAGRDHYGRETVLLIHGTWSKQMLMLGISEGDLLRGASDEAPKPEARREPGTCPACGAEGTFIAATLSGEWASIRFACTAKKGHGTWHDRVPRAQFEGALPSDEEATD